MIKGVTDPQQREHQEEGVPPVSGGEEIGQILVPVSEHDHTRARNRVRNRNLLLGVLAIAGVAFAYKHYTDPIRALDDLDSGERQLKSGRYQQAILFFDQAIGIIPDYAEAYQQRGRAQMALFKPAEAVPDFLRYVELRPEDPAGYLDLGRAHLGVEDFRAALQDGALAVQYGSKTGAAYQLRGIARRRLGMLIEALEDFDQAVELAPEMANYYERGATLQDLGRHASAIEAFTEVIKFDGANAQAFHARSKSYRALGNIVQADLDRMQGRKLDGR